MGMNCIWHLFKASFILPDWCLEKSPSKSYGWRQKTEHVRWVPIDRSKYVSVTASFQPSTINRVVLRMQYPRTWHRLCRPTQNTGFFRSCLAATEIAGVNPERPERIIKCLQTAFFKMQGLVTKLITLFFLSFFLPSNQTASLPLIYPAKILTG